MRASAEVGTILVRSVGQASESVERLPKMRILPTRTAFHRGSAAIEADRELSMHVTYYNEVYLCFEATNTPAGLGRIA